MKKVCIFTFMFLFLLFFVPNIAATDVDCEVIDTDTDDCGDGTIIIKMSEPHDAHAAVHDDENFRYALCCHGLVEETRECEEGDVPDNFIISLSDSADAHASAGLNFPEFVCLNNLVCGSETDCSDMGTEFFCVLGLSDNIIDAHVGPCTGDFVEKICCKETGGSSGQPECGNGVKETGEQCDCGDDGVCTQAELNFKSCQSLGFDSGEISCYPAGHENECEFDDSGCIDAGYQICTPNEMGCFGKNLRQCSSAGTAWEVVEVCEYDCYEGECTEAPGGGFTLILVGVVAAVVIIVIVSLAKS